MRRRTPCIYGLEAFLSSNAPQISTEPEYTHEAKSDLPPNDDLICQLTGKAPMSYATWHPVDSLADHALHTERVLPMQRHQDPSPYVPTWRP